MKNNELAAFSESHILATAEYLLDDSLEQLQRSFEELFAMPIAKGLSKKERKLIKNNHARMADLLVLIREEREQDRTGVPS